MPTFDYGSSNTPAYEITLAENATAIIASGDVLNSDGTGIDEVKVNGGSDASKFTLTYVDDATSFQLDFAVAPDFDSPGDSDADNAYEIILKATDKDGETATVTYTVKITDVNEAPVFSSTAAISRLEKTTSNASDVSALTVTSTDPEASAITYTIIGGNDSARFDVDSSTGVLTFKAAPDYDAPLDTGTDNVYDIQVQASDGTNNATQNIAITIVDVNEAPSITQPSATAFSVQENWTAPVTYVDFSDPDFETIASGKITYQLSGNDQSLFTLDSGTGILTFTNAPSYEAPGDVDKNNAHEITVTVRDSAGLTGSTNLTVTVINVNDAPAIAIDSTSADITVAADSSVTVSGYEVRANGLPGFKFSSLDNSQITISDDDYSGSGLPQLLLWLKLDEDAGSVAVDSSGNGFNADLQGGNATPGWTSGNDAANNRDYSALDFNGTTDYLQITDASASALRPDDASYSVALWFKQDSINQNMVFFNKGTTVSTTPTNGVLGYMTGNGYHIFRAADGSNVAHAYKNGLDMDWHHYVAVIDRAQKLLTVYIDEIAYVQQSGFSGSNVSDLTTMGSINNTLSITVGSDGTNHFDGMLDDLRIYNGAISDKQVAELRSGGDPGQMQVTLEVGQGTLSLGDPAATGVTITTGDGTDDTTIIFQGTYTAASSALDGLTYTPNTDFNGTDTLSIQADDQDTLNVGGAKKTTVSYSLNVQAVNNPPVNNTPGSQSVNEAGSLAFSAANGNGFSITDDASENPSAVAGDSDIQVSLTAQSSTGVLSLGTTTGLDFSGGAGDGTEDVTMTFTGTVENINTALDTLVFSLAGTGADTNFNGTATLTIETNDKGNYGLDDLATPDPGKTTQEETDVDTISISVLPVNDPPTITLADASVVENTTFVGQATVADPDLSDANSTESHTYSIYSGADKDFFEIDGDGNLSFKAAPSFENPQDDDKGNTYNVTVRVTDSGGLTSDQAITVTVTDANDIPTFTTTTTTHQVAENQTSVVVIAGTDEDAGQSVAYSVTGGVDKDLFQIDATTGVLTFKAAPDYESPGSVGGANDYLVEITLTDDNAPTPATSASALALTVQVTDVNDAPTITTAAAIAVNEEKADIAIIVATDQDSGDTVTFSLTGGADLAHFAIDSASGALTFANIPSFETPADADTQNDYVVEVSATDTSSATAATMFTITVTDVNDFPKVTNGSVAFTAAENQTTAAAITATDDDSSNVLAFTLVATGDYALFDLTTTSTAPASGAATLTFKTAPDYESPGDAGADNVYDVTLQIADGAETTTQAITVTVTNENDPPVYSSFPGSITADEDTAIDFSTASGNLITVADPDVSDAGADLLQVTLQVVGTNGVLTFANTSNVTITAGANASTAITFQGNPSALNTTLNGFTFLGTEHYNGSETIKVTIDDLGNKDGAAQTLENTIDLTITAINDEPVNTLPAAQTTNEDIALVLSQANGNQISVADPDSGDNTQALTVTLTVPDFDNSGAADGTLTFATTLNLTFDTSAGGGDGTAAASLFTFTGTITNLNTALNGITFNPAADFNGTAKINIVSTDTLLTDTDDLAIIVTAVNDAPAWTVPGAQTVNEDETLTFTTVATVAQVDTVTVSDGADGDVFTLTIDGNDQDFTFAGDAAQTATALATAVNGSSTLNVLVTAADQGGGVVTLTAATAGTPFTATIATKTNTSGNATASLTTTTANVSDSTLSIADDSSEDSSSVQLTISSTLGLLVLSSNNGLTFDEAQGGTQAASTTTGASRYVFTGTVANINTALQGLKYTPLADKNGSDTLSLSVDDQGNHGTGNNSVVPATVAITITPVNDGPSVTAPTAVQQINEDEPITFNTANGNAVSVTDPDAAEVKDELEVTVSALYGTLTLSTIANLTFTEGSGPTGSTMKFKGTEANLNTALTDLIYTPGADHNDNAGSEVLTIQVSDQSYNGTQTLTATATISVQVTAINDTPSITFANANPSTDEDTALVLNAANSNAITITDDATESNKVIQVTLTAVNGTLTLAATDGLTFNGTNGSANFIFAGTSGNIATALEGLQYLPGFGSNGFGFNGTDTVTVLVQDLGGTGSGGFLEATNSFNVTVNAVNDAPVHLFNGSNASTAQTTKEDTSLTFNAANGNAITLTDDSDEGDTAVKTTLSVDTGTLTLATKDNLTFTTGDGDTDASMDFTGKLTDINTALEGLVFAPASDSSATATLTIVTDDQGNTGTGGAMTDTDTVTINVTAVNDGPTITFANNAPTTSEDVALLFNADANTLITLADDASENGSQVSLQLGVTAGTLTLALDADALTTNNIGIIAGANPSSTMTLTGAVDKLNLALDGLQYNAPADYVGTPTLTLIADDLGNYGEGDAQQDTATATITVNPVNDAPVLALPGDSFVNEDATLTFSTANANTLTVSDPDTYSDSSAIQATIKLVDDADVAVADRGTFTLGSVADLTFTTGDGTDDASMVFLGSLTAVNTALNGLVYTPPADYNGEVYLKTTIDDQGNIGDGAALTNDATAGADEVKITVIAYNDGPVITAAAAALETDEDSPITFTAANTNALSVVDVDYDETTGGLLLVTLSVTNGKLTFNAAADLENNFTFTIGDGTDDSAMIFQTTETSLNTALDGMTYTPDADYNESDGTSTLTLTINDQGQTGSGGTLTATKSIPIAVKAVNDTPVITLITEATIDEDNTYTLAVANGNAVIIADVDTHESTGNLTLTISVTSGTFTAPSLGEDVTVIAGDGIADATLTIAGTPTQVTAALEGLLYTPNAHFNGTDSLIITANDGGNQGGDGSAATSTSTLTLNVSAINDAPELTLPGTQITDEDTTITFSTANANALSTADVDAPETDPGKVQLVLTVSQGTLTLATQQDLTIDAGADASATMTLTGTTDQLNTALNGLVYAPAQDFNGTDTLAVTLSDLGLTGSGGTLTATGNLTLTLNSVNDAPVITLPAAPTIEEDTLLTFSAAFTNGISVADVDIGDSPMVLALSVNDGTLKLATTDDILINTGADASATMTLQGTLANLNTAVDGIIYTPDAHFNGTSTLTVISNDGGAEGSGGVLETKQTLDITVSALNDAPTFTLPDAPIINEDASLTFSAANANAIVIADDATETTSDIQLALTVKYGTLTLGSTDGVTITSGADKTTTVTLKGTAAAITTALDGLTYTPDAGANAITMSGTDDLQLAADDLGANGTGGAQTQAATLPITVTALNDAPVLTAPSTASIDEDNQLIFSTANSTLISFSDDGTEDASNVELSLTASHGILTLDTTTGVTIDPGADASTFMTLVGTVININNAIDGLSFKPDANYNGTAQVQATINDLGNAGNGAAETVTKTVALTVNAVNDAPVITVPGAQTADEDTPVTFSTAANTAITVADADVGEGTGDLQLALTVNYGKLSLASTDGLIFTTGSDNSATMTLTGIPVKMNAALEGLVYTPNTDVNDNDTLTLTLSDLGDTGSGGEQTATASIALTLNSINDAPLNNLPAAQSNREDQALTLSTATSNLFSISDDAAESTTALEVQLAVQNGTLTLAGNTGLTITAGADASASLTFTGQLADINTALDGLLYTPTADYFGDDALTVTTIDNGGTGTGGTLTDTDTLAITVQPVNDAPVNTLPSAQGTNEETTLTFNAANQNAISIYDDASVAGLPLNVSLESTNGYLTLSTTDNLQLTGGTLNPGSTLHITGMMDDINAALSGMTYTPNTDFTGDATITITTDDLGNKDDFGSDPLTDTDTLTITVNEVNDGPVITAPTALLTSSEDATFTFSEAQGLAITIADPDTYGVASTLKLTLTADNGTLTFAETSGLSIISGSNGSSAMVVLATPQNLNLSLEGMLLTPTTDYVGTVTLTLAADDQGNSGTGGALTDSATVQVYHSPTNDAPILTVPSGQTLNEDGELVFSGSVIQLQDDADAADTLKIEATATNGMVKLTTTDSGVTVTQDGSAGTLGFSGTLTQINSAFNGLTFSPTADFAGEAIVSLSADDQGAGGSGGAMTGTATISMTVAGVNDAPTIVVPAVQTVDHKASLAFSSSQGNAITLADIDAGDSSIIQVSLLSLEGTLTLGSTDGITLTTGDGTTDASIAFTANVATAVTALEGLVYTPAEQPGLSTQVQVTVDDQGNTGTGGTRSATTTVDITINHNPPVIDQGESVTATMQEDNPSSWTTPTITATDPTGEAITWSLHAQPAKGSATVSGNGTSPTITYVPNTDYSGADSFSMKATDASSNSSILTVNVDITPVNDSPAFSSTPVTEAAGQEYSYALTATDIDGDSLTFSTNTLPSWLTLKSNADGTATLSGTYTGQGAGTGALLSEAADLGLGWKYSEWFGAFYEDPSGWLYHTSLGWVYVSDKTSTTFWFWTEKLGWVWTGATEFHEVSLAVSDGTASTSQAFTVATGTFPSLYSPEAGTWLHYETTSSPAQFYNYATGKWIGSIYSYAVNVTATSGGTVIGSGTFGHGETATLSATPATGYKFTGWTGDRSSADTTLQLSITGAINLQANFAELDASDWAHLFD